ncbi:2'-5' RNA ligase family protein [Pararhizobium antarcticum]|uniref:Phosphoesterase HXTX n=1 Tax=Pararhizobium antarcticum TaxID=1798805 RepID=A0A657LQU3_9HYPH|nr:2'-5' RNA ligase family protein [Pararhizobium antarcticum]OJF94946.1 hypothetical protein AX760_03685 [Pararhizobium antarcticum]OJF97448.1 hypothetical protein AX761_14585 [Rhizobium sp. 58]
MKTLQPLILTSRVSDDDLAPFDLLRRKHFPADRNFLRAHLTMFHRLPGEHMQQIVEQLMAVAAGQAQMKAEVYGLRHLGAGVAFRIASPDLQDVHARLRRAFIPWLGGQDMQTWQPHITIQNKVSKQAADTLHAALMTEFQPHAIAITGLDLWLYQNGPWQHERTVLFGNGP